MIPRVLRASAVTAACAACLLGAAPASAANLQPAGINLGGTSFFDGFGRNEGGFTYLTYLQYGRADAIHGDDGKPQPYFNDPRINAVVWINQLVYTVPEPLFGDSAHVGINFVVPLVGFITSFGEPPPFPGVQLSDNGVGMGDLTFGPMLQFKPILVDGRPLFSHRFEVDLIAPVGKYDPAKDINPSSNFVSVVPYWAGTLVPFSGLEVSARLHYLYNFTNHRPALGRLYSLEVPPPVAGAKAGQATWVNFASSYEIFSHVHVGVNGYYFHQINLDLWEMLDGTSNPGTRYADTGKARVFAIGPGAMVGAGDHDKLFLNLYTQLSVYNWPRSDVVNLRWVHSFP